MYFTTGWVLDVEWNSTRKRTLFCYWAKWDTALQLARLPSVHGYLLVGSSGTVLTALHLHGRVSRNLFSCGCSTSLGGNSCSSSKWRTMYLNREQMVDADTSQRYSLLKRYWKCTDYFFVFMITTLWTSSAISALQIVANETCTLPIAFVETAEGP